MRVVWFAVIVVTAVPLAYVALLLNPLVYFALGPERWRQQVARLHPYRWSIGALVVACAVATAVYGARWG